MCPTLLCHQSKQFQRITEYHYIRIVILPENEQNGGNEIIPLPPFFIISFIYSYIDKEKGLILVIGAELPIARHRKAIENL